MINCRFCKNELTDLVIDLNNQPSANALISKKHISNIINDSKEEKYPLAVYLCSKCKLAQLGKTIKPSNLFTFDYPYYSSISQNWLSHAKNFVKSAILNFNLTIESKVLEIGSNDGYLLQYFVENNISCLGVDPAGKAAEVASDKGVNTLIDFFNVKTAKKIVDKYGKQDLIIGNNVFGHIPDIVETIDAFKICMSEDSIISLEVPHLLSLIKNNLFDTIYDEHYFYFSVIALKNIFEKFNLKIFKVEKHSLHGGSIRISVTHTKNQKYHICKEIEEIIFEENKLNINKPLGYLPISKKILDIKNTTISFIKKLKKQGKSVAGYGAAAKGNVFLNYCKISSQEIDFIVDDTPAKQNHWLPGSHIPIYHPNKLLLEKPDVIIILPWNFREEIENKLKKINVWGAQTVTFIPDLVVNYSSDF